MSDSNQNVTVSLGSPCFLLFLVFLVLKLTNVIGWSWWWITAPLWGGLAILFAFLGIFLVIAIIGAILVAIFGKK